MRVFLIFFFAVITVAANAQNWAPVGAKWYYSSSTTTTPPNAQYYLYESEKDTIIAGKNARKISVTHFKYTDDIVKLAPVLTYNVADTVFYYHDLHQKFVPLYIFNVKAGDTLTYYNPEISTIFKDTFFRVLVDSINLNEINNVYLRSVYTTPLDDFSFFTAYTETIGGEWMMFPEPSIGLPERDGPIRCYSDDNISHNFTNMACDFRQTVGIGESSEQQNFILFPNPAKNYLRIQQNQKQQADFTIFNSEGKIMQTGSLKNENEIVMVEKLGNGVYFFCLNTGKSFSIRQFVISK